MRATRLLIVTLLLLTCAVVLIYFQNVFQRERNIREEVPQSAATLNADQSPRPSFSEVIVPVSQENNASSIATGTGGRKNPLVGEE